MQPPVQATLEEYKKARALERAALIAQGIDLNANCATGEQMAAHYRDPGPETLDEWLGRLFT